MQALSKRSFVVRFPRSFFAALSAKMGVPVKPKQLGVIKETGDLFMCFSKLTAVAFVKNENNTLVLQMVHPLTDTGRGRWRCSVSGWW
jgi:hypothetical protein